MTVQCQILSFAFHAESRETLKWHTRGFSLGNLTEPFARAFVQYRKTMRPIIVTTASVEDAREAMNYRCELESN